MPITAHIYGREGLVRCPQGDWVLVPDISLWANVLALSPWFISVLTGLARAISLLGYVRDAGSFWCVIPLCFWHGFCGCIHPSTGYPCRSL